MSGNSFATANSFEIKDSLYEVSRFASNCITDSLNLADAVRERAIVCSSPHLVSNILLAMFTFTLIAVVVYLYRYFSTDTGEVKCRCGGYISIDESGGTCLRCGKHYGVDGIIDLIFRRLK